MAASVSGTALAVSIVVGALDGLTLLVSPGDVLLTGSRAPLAAQSCRQWRIKTVAQPEGKTDKTINAQKQRIWNSPRDAQREVSKQAI